jgi:hypothetical protein
MLRARQQRRRGAKKKRVASQRCEGAKKNLFASWRLCEKKKIAHEESKKE